MKILHISNFGDKHNGRLYWNQCFKISNGFIRNGHNVYNFSERDKSRSHWLNKLSNNKNLQKSVLQTVRNYNPDIVLLGHADRVHLETIEEIKQRDHKDMYREESPLVIPENAVIIDNTNKTKEETIKEIIEKLKL